MWFSEDPSRHYGFIELGSVELAEKVLIKMDGMLVLGVPINVKRPNDTNVQRDLMAGTTAAGGPMAISNVAAPVCTSRIIRIDDAIVDAQADDEDFDDTLEDMMEGAKQV